MEVIIQLRLNQTILIWNLFQKWDTSIIDDSEKESIIMKFDDYLKENKIHSANDLKSNDAYSKQDGVLYGKSHLAIQKGNADGTQKNVVELNDESSLKLYLTEDNSFLV